MLPLKALGFLFVRDRSPLPPSLLPSFLFRLAAAHKAANNPRIVLSSPVRYGASRPREGGREGGREGMALAGKSWTICRRPSMRARVRVLDL